VGDVAQPDLERVEAEVLRDEVEDAFPHERLRCPRAAVGDIRRLVGNGRGRLETEGSELVRAREHRLDDRRDRRAHAHARVGAGVDDHLHVQSEQVAVVADGGPDVEALLARLSRRGEVFAAVLDPLDRPAEGT
jgi:hypothetical protein